MISSSGRPSTCSMAMKSMSRSHPDIVHRDNIRVDQGGRGAGFAHQALPVDGIVQLVRAEHFQRDAAVQARVPRAVDNAHAALADLGFDTVWPQHFAARQVRRQAGKGAEHGIFERPAFGVQQPLHLFAEAGIGAAVLSEKRRPLCFLQFERGCRKLP